MKFCVNCRAPLTQGIITYRIDGVDSCAMCWEMFHAVNNEYFGRLHTLYLIEQAEKDRLKPGKDYLA